MKCDDVATISNKEHRRLVTQRSKRPTHANPQLIFLRFFLPLTALLLTLSVAASPVRAQDDGGDDPPPVNTQRTPISAANYYGINFIQPFDPWLSLGKKSGVGYVRWQFNWRDAETSPGQWNWAASDGPIQSWNNAGVKIDAILHFPPDWALETPGGLVPKNFNLAWNDPGNGWAHFCQNFAQRYKGKIASYEIWNEPDLDQFWQGTAEQYYVLMKTCYQAIKSVDTNTPVSMAGMALVIERDFFPTVVRLAAQDPEGPANNYFFDAAAIHMYADPDYVYSLTIETQHVLDTYGLGYKAIWITETNIALAGHGRFKSFDWGHVSEDEQGWYILQAAVNAFAGGAQRLMFFRLADDGMDESFGLVQQTGNPRPSYRALQLATSVLHDVVDARREIREGVIVTYLLRSDGSRVIALFSKAGTGLNVEIEARQPAAVLITSDGGYSLIRSENGIYTVPVPDAIGRDFNRGHAVGGPVILLVEQDNQPPVAAIKLEALPGDADHVNVVWNGDDGPLGTGISGYDVQVSINDGEWQDWQTGVAYTYAPYDISAGGKFAFRLRAIDNAGNFSEFTEPTTTMLVPEGTLKMEITDLRGQHVPYTRVTLSDGTLHDADANGIVTITQPPGLIRITRIDGSAQGQLAPGQPFEIELAEEADTSWMLLPQQNLIRNGDFEFGSQGWDWSAPADAATVRGPANHGNVLRLQGGRRPWGQPSASTELDLPQGWNAGVLSFYYRVPDPDSQLRVRVISDDSQRMLWQSQGEITDFYRVWVDLSAYEGQHITIRFELVSNKGASKGSAEVDDVILGNIPVLP